MAEENIHIKGARVHNLKNMEVKIPHGKMTVITGLSGSGKSSLAFDTLYAEGQRRYIESLSSYARQFLGKLDKPDVDFIKGVSPAIAIQQKVISTNPRSTVGTVTEIYDYLKILFARIGKTYSPISNEIVKKHSVTDVIDALHKQPEGTRALIIAPIHDYQRYGFQRQLEIFKEQGYARVIVDEVMQSLDESIALGEIEPSSLGLVIDRITTKKEDEENDARLADSVQLAFAEGKGYCTINFPTEGINTTFSNRFELDGIEFVEPSEHFFTFNNPYGACKTCEGFGSVIGIDEDLVIPNRSMSVYEGAVMPWKGEKMSRYLDKFIRQAAKVNFPIHRPVEKLSEGEYQLLWEGNKEIDGINNFFGFIESKLYKIYHRVLLAKYRGKTLCKDCRGTRLRKDANYVKVDGKTITDMVLSSIEDNLNFFQGIQLDAFDQSVAGRILTEIQNRLQWLSDVGLGYLTLNRQANSLSGGESQRINLATSLGSSLVGSMYILDEPSIGLHPRDTERLIGVLKSLKELGNTVIIVEHEEAVMMAADEILDIGPKAGIHGGNLVFQGTHAALKKAKNSLTADYLSGRREIPIPKKRRKSPNKITIEQARENNLKGIDVAFPLHELVCISGVSGSGKSTLVKQLLYPAVRKHLGIYGDKIGKFGGISGDLSRIQAVELIDQNPIGRSSRSNPVTYVKAFDEIRDLFAKQVVSKARAYKPGFFSFNVPGGRCDRCEGEGIITVSMQFMADVHLTCESCHGKRYKNETLEVTYRGQTISDILDMNIEDAFHFFAAIDERLEQKIAEKIQPLVDVGLGYLQMGQPSSTLSGGEAQRIKLASFLAKAKKPTPTLFIFDEPTTGLHFYDIEKLLVALNRLIDIGHSVIVIEHDMDVLKCADHIIDLGPEGGVNGGYLQFSGTPEELIASTESFTGEYMKSKL
ncbi:MAG: excinuclease ABC subunit UvrA [Crocinitomicaceae bacterium]|nr:excinuclease ABC subunit UvrA [Crocinitomicaceae bacterium]